MNYQQRAKELFFEGYNCAQAVFTAFAEEKYGKDEAARLASAFGGGMGGQRMECGAFSGMLLAYGLLRGYDVPGDLALKEAYYETVQELTRRFTEALGTTSCRKQLGLPEGVIAMPPAPRTPEYYDTRPCPKLVEQAAGILEAYLKETSCEAEKAEE